MEIQINQDLKSLIPPLSVQEYDSLEQSILLEGCRDSIVIWQDFIIDGHNRYEICIKHGIKYSTSTKHFDDIDDVKIWMIRNQFSRRNISSFVRTELALKLKPLIAAKAELNLIRSGKEYGKGLQNSAEPIEPIDTRQEVAKAAHVSHDTIARVEKILEHATPEQIEKLRAGDNDVSINSVYKEIKDQEKKQELEEKKQEYQAKVEEKKTQNINGKVDIFNTQQKFRIIYADPPWKYDLEQTSPNLGGAIKHYDSMDIEQLCALPVKEITQKDAVLFLWITSPKLNLFLELMTAWGFEYKTSFVWDKVKHNMGHYNSVRHEFLLIGGKGKSAPDIKKLHDSVIQIERSETHSEKPIEFMNIIDELYIHGERLEMFCRQPKKDGWFFFGNEI